MNSITYGERITVSAQPHFLCDRSQNSKLHIELEIFFDELLMLNNAGSHCTILNKPVLDERRRLLLFVYHASENDYRDV